MGFDVTFHPVSEQEILKWYFAGLEDEKAAESFAQSQGLDEFYVAKYLEILSAGRATDGSPSFDQTHGYYIAAVQGLFRKHHYIRGGALSFYGDAMLPYMKPWSDIVPASYNSLLTHNRLTENYMSGVYIPADKIVSLMQALTAPSELSEFIPDVHPDQHLDILLTALRDANEHGCGLLEATEIVEPHPFNLNASSSVSNLFNCDTAGPLLYEKVARAQIAQLEKQQGMAPGSIDPSQIERNVAHTVEHAPSEAKKRGFFSRLFGKKYVCRSLGKKVL